MGYDIINRLQAMMAKAKSTSSAAEAESIMTKVHDLLAKHGVSLLTITERERTSLDPVGVTMDALRWWASDSWTLKLAAAAARYYGVRLITTKNGNQHIAHIVGRTSCRVTFQEMLPYIKRCISALARKGYAAGDFASISIARNQIGVALGYRLYALAYEAEAKVEAATTPTKETAGRNALVPVDAIESAAREAFPTSHAHDPWKNSPRVSLEAVHAAREISLSRQLGERESTTPAWLPEPKNLIR